MNSEPVGPVAVHLINPTNCKHPKSVRLRCRARRSSPTERPDGVVGRHRTPRKLIAMAVVLCALIAGCGPEGDMSVIDCFAHYTIYVHPVTMDCLGPTDLPLILDERVTAAFRVTDVRSGEVVRDSSLDVDSFITFEVELLDPGRPHHIFLRLCRENGDCMEAEAVVDYERGERRGTCHARVREPARVELPQGGFINLRERSGGGGFSLPTDPDVCAELLEGLEESESTAGWPPRR